MKTIVARMPIMILVIVLLSISLFLFIAPIVAPYDPLKVEMGSRLLPISSEHWLGTDHLGRDILSRLLVGAQVTVGSTFLILFLSIAIGLPFGLISGYVGGWVDRVLMRIVDAILAFPDYIVAIVLTGLLGPGLSNLVISVIIVKWVKYTRLVRGTVLSEKYADYIAMAKVNGLNPFQILTKHIIPHVMGNVLVLATLDIGKTILLIASLSYIGLGNQPPNPEWGSMLNEGKQFFYNEPQLMFIPGIAIVIVVLFFNLFGDKLRDYYDVKNKQGGY
ncbi:nickel transporter permease [Longirhabdus pacifica]|uniref:nickel transporter permease n=1 Tax=Longirhabdus pacifica TaxID=2305227 RepID=UPI001008BF3A